MPQAKFPRVGIDLDGVIIDHRQHKLTLAGEHGFALAPWQTNSNVMSGYLPEDVYEDLQDKLYADLTVKAPPIQDALATLRQLRAEIYIISARRASTLRYAQDWLAKHRVYDTVPAERIFFCGSGDEKKGYCIKYGLHAFLDDKASVLDGLPGSTKRVLFDDDGVSGKLDLGKRFHVAKDWKEFKEYMETLKP
jgi:hypothetical protein